MLTRRNDKYKIKNIRINGQHESFSNFSEHKHTILNKQREYKQSINFLYLHICKKYHRVKMINPISLSINYKSK